MYAVRDDPSRRPEGSFKICALIFLFVAFGDCYPLAKICYNSSDESREYGPGKRDAAAPACTSAVVRLTVVAGCMQWIKPLQMLVFWPLGADEPSGE